MHSVFKNIVAEVAGAFEYKTDLELYGKPEWWAELKDVGDLLQGDCEDFCITVANRCMDNGIPAQDLVLHLVATRHKPDHIILEHDGWFADCNAKKINRHPPYKKISKRQLSQPHWESV